MTESAAIRLFIASFLGRVGALYWELDAQALGDHWGHGSV